MNWLLLLALAIIGICAFAGWRAGFIKSIFSKTINSKTIFCDLIALNTINHKKWF